MTIYSTVETRQSSLRNILKLSVFLLGILMGALDNSIVSPARTLIQKGFNITGNTGIWMITLYTLVFAVSMPLVSKLSDLYGRKRIFTAAITTFGFGSMLVGLTNIVPVLGHFEIFLAARVIQAIGAGGLIPIATAEITYSFPENKRGAALGMIGGIYGIASVIGPTLGSFILDLAGGSHWGWLFFINVPPTLLAILLSRVIPKHVEKVNSSFDIFGSISLAILVSSLLYALTNLNFFEFGKSITSIHVFPFLLIFALMIPLLILAETRTQDPILNLRYFRHPEILKVLILSFTIGAGFISIIFLPQFAENSLMLKAGSGGYLVTLLAVFSGVSAPLSGRLIDKYGARLVLALGFIFNIIGFMELALLVPRYLNLLSILPGYLFVGLGMGFTIGAPLNYLMLKNIPQQESATGIATLSLIRSIGVTLSPGILIGFIVNAGKNVMPNLQKAIPLFQQSPSSGGTSNGNMSSFFENVDVTNIVEKLKGFLAGKLPDKIKDMVMQQIDTSGDLIRKTYQRTLNDGFRTMFIVVSGISVLGVIILLVSKKAKTREV